MRQRTCLSYASYYDYVAKAEGITGSFGSACDSSSKNSTCLSDMVCIEGVCMCDFGL